MNLFFQSKQNKVSVLVYRQNNNKVRVITRTEIKCMRGLMKNLKGKHKKKLK